RGHGGSVDREEARLASRLGVAECGDRRFEETGVDQRSVGSPVMDLNQRQLTERVGAVVDRRTRPLPERAICESWLRRQVSIHCCAVRKRIQHDEALHIVALETWRYTSRQR